MNSDSHVHFQKLVTWWPLFLLNHLSLITLLASTDCLVRVTKCMA